MHRCTVAKNIVLAIALIVATTSAIEAYTASEDTGSTGSVTITKHAKDAAKAFAEQNYAKARDEYRTAIGLSPDTLEFYYGLYDVCMHSHEWAQVVFALERIFALDPAKKKQLGAEYGEALYNVGRYDDAIPVLKQALKDADLPLPKLSLVVPAPVPSPPLPEAKPQPSNTTSSAQPVAPAPPPMSYVKNTAPVSIEEGSLAQFTKSYENAVHSECIVIAEYVGYTHSPDITFFNPPQAHYHITKILKGPPLNKDLPIRYEFHDRSKVTAPEGWKFGPDKMPEKGSEWIIFIKNAVPRGGMFDTYEGLYGRQPANDENLNKVYALLEGSANR